MTKDGEGYRKRGEAKGTLGCARIGKKQDRCKNAAAVLLQEILKGPQYSTVPS